MELNRMIDHTILKADATQEDVLRIIEEAKKYHFYSVCINPTWVSFAAEQLKGEPTAVCTVIGFPLGANTSEVKAYETTDAIHNGADEVDMVINIGALKSAQYKKVQQDIEAVVNAAKDKALVKVIIETALLTNEEIVKACELAKTAGADFVKTSTGFSTGGATVEDVRLMRQTVGPEMGVKASGGIHNEQEAMAMVEAGANRLGTSASIAIVTGAQGGGY
ncbi:MULTISPECIES: deoxyribose-phosphate aldolase [Enterococcus]|jgi:deoxyribose-phosphate aldolase|uniref:Deoxyribose-phosphate aldolase n=1 Tax=Enterococcus dispar ATCC 51266 TaxID=1139219 RepID=S0KD96_9ENTE|nr:deoxyribose-phosphate aldolase [Enterococcus dispar]EOT38890.1 deoxyribose-phosphate aldolase [Enterococcus dispar ATCC 51266]EOW86209.1 deoxyribose-phosphate aldolase [Enterococcus dispar ATCC 51266]MCU7357127.1 deoxyribose-phosphate aldolase [Enterococcus dispar]MDT2705232.1 deoxyribose-phosphate aldolase [Enterococcus dispar]OJG39206.1 deoxyribose-phosphate aldolase [Enterococcus dispar]